MVFTYTVLAVIAGLGVGALYSRISISRFKREHFIRTFVFPRRLFDELHAHHPALDEKAQFLVARALRIFFLAHLRARDQVIGMPSKAADALWHTFILDTKAYTQFCHEAFGKYFHHIPAASMHKGIYADEALQRTWRLACLEENIDPKAATRLPLLFALDTKLAFPNGNTFSLEGKRKEGSDSGCGGFGCGGGNANCADGAGDCGDGGGCGG